MKITQSAPPTPGAIYKEDEIKEIKSEKNEGLKETVQNFLDAEATMMLTDDDAKKTCKHIIEAVQKDPGYLESLKSKDEYLLNGNPVCLSVNDEYGREMMLLPPDPRLSVEKFIKEMGDFILMLDSIDREDIEAQKSEINADLLKNYPAAKTQINDLSDSIQNDHSLIAEAECSYDADGNVDIDIKGRYEKLDEWCSSVQSSYDHEKINLLEEYKRKSFDLSGNEDKIFDNETPDESAEVNSEDQNIKSSEEAVIETLFDFLPNEEDQTSDNETPAENAEVNSEDQNIESPEETVIQKESLDPLSTTGEDKTSDNATPVENAEVNRTDHSTKSSEGGINFLQKTNMNKSQKSSIIQQQLPNTPDTLKKPEETEINEFVSTATADKTNARPRPDQMPHHKPLQKVQTHQPDKTQDKQIHKNLETETLRTRLKAQLMELFSKTITHKDQYRDLITQILSGPNGEIKIRKLIDKVNENEDYNIIQELNKIRKQQQDAISKDKRQAVPKDEFQPRIKESSKTEQKPKPLTTQAAIDETVKLALRQKPARESDKSFTDKIVGLVKGIIANKGLKEFGRFLSLFKKRPSMKIMNKLKEIDKEIRRRPEK